MEGLLVFFGIIAAFTFATYWIVIFWFYHLDGGKTWWLINRLSVWYKNLLKEYGLIALYITIVLIIIFGGYFAMTWG